MYPKIHYDLITLFAACLIYLIVMVRARKISDGVESIFAVFGSTLIMLVFILVWIIVFKIPR